MRKILLFVLVLLVPALAGAFDGVLLRPDGSPAAGHQVSVVGLSMRSHGLAWISACPIAHPNKRRVVDSTRFARTGARSATSATRIATSRPAMVSSLRAPHAGMSSRSINRST